METRIFFATDVHGSERCFMKFTNAGKFYKANVVILGGDLTGKLVVPIVEQPDGIYVAQYMGVKRTLKSEEELRALEKDIRFSGYYPYCTTLEEVEELNANKKKVDKLFSRLMVETLERWMRIVEERLRGTGIRCFIMPGNDDRLDIDQILERSEYVVNPEGKVTSLDAYHEMMSTGWSNRTPWNAPRECDEETLAQKIEAMASQVKNMENCIFNFHCPPYNSVIDTAPKVDKDLRPVIDDGHIVMIPAGSAAIRAAIEKYKPLLGLHGHIHESRGTYKLGRTVCLNPGSEYGEGILRGVLVDLDRKGIKRYLFTSG